VSEPINIENKNNIVLSISAFEQGTHETSDFLDLAYSVNNGAYVTLPNWQGKGDSSHTLIDDFTHADLNVDIPAGDTLTIKVSMRNGASSEYIRFDNVKVTFDGEIDGGSDSGGNDGEPAEDTTITDACFNCPDLTKINQASDYIDNQYYETVFDALANEQDGSTIKSSINQSISIGHQKLSYSEAWTALTQTDEDPLNQDNVILFYRGTSLAKFSNGSGTQSSDPDNWNREHVWAKSHGFPSGSAHAYSDIHHLRPTDISVNSSRGNLDFDYSDSPLGEAPENRVDSDSFEPRDAVKGDVARIVFYMDTRYEGFDGSTPDLQVVNNLTSVGQAKLGKLCALLAWNEQDPVDDFERERNNTIYEFQGNRNPYIDHPEWISAVYNLSCEDNSTDPDPVEPDPTDPVPPVEPDPSEPSSDANLFISEYIEGSSFNKAVEIYNPTAEIVDLSTVQFKLYSNGSDSQTASYQLTGVLPPNQVVVLGHPQISEETDLFNQVDYFSNAVNFNGDDYIELTINGNIVDSAGHYGVKQSWGANTTLIRKTYINHGDTNRNDTFDVNDEWESHSSNTFTFIGAHVVDDIPSVDEPTIPTIGACEESAHLINQIQGSTNISPLVGQTVTIEGVVTSVVPSLNGYFVQEELIDQDNNKTTSEALFVFDENSSSLPEVGQTIRVQGAIKEQFERTQLTVTADVNWLDCGVGVITAATSAQMPATSTTSWENLEGMLVMFDQPLQVTDTYNLARFGQLSLSNGRLIKPTNMFTPNSPQAIQLAEENMRNILLLDDKNNAQNPETVPFPNGSLAYNNTIRLGDRVNNLVGIVDYSYGSYRILPTQPVNFETTNPRTNTTTHENNEEKLKVVGFNVLNYFNGDGSGNGFPTARGANTLEEFERQSTKIVSALTQINADIVGLMELENDGFGSESAIAELTNRINTALGEGTYQYVSVEQPGIGNDEITVGLLYKTDTVTLAGDAVTTDQGPFDYGNRQPLAQTFTSQHSGESFTVVVNHFKSKGSCSSATGLNADLNDGQGCWNELRKQAAQGLHNWLETKPTDTTDSDILIIGDLNAYAKEDPITMLETLGYSNVVTAHEGINAYSYSFGGEMGSLDHALASPSLNTQIVDTYVWHINADEPRAFDYNTENKSTNQLNDYYGSSAYRASDHDPIIVTIALNSEAQLVGDFDNDLDIDSNDLIAFMLMLRGSEPLDIAFDFNADGIVNRLDIRGLMTLCTRVRCATE